MSRRALYLLVAGSLLGAVWLITGDLSGLSGGFYFLAPAILLAMPLIAGRYVGAERLTRIVRSRSRSGRRRPALKTGHAPRAWRRVAVRGGLLIASSLAVRPPPLVLTR